MKPIIIPLPFSYKKPNAEVWVFNTTALPIPVRKIKDQQMIVIGPGAVGGNHKHPRTEWFIAFSPGLKLFWLDEQNMVQEVDMFSKKEELVLIEMPPFVPHAVKNMDKKQKVILIEFADEKMKNSEFIQVI
ncbi:MAG: hypothetical protein ABI425_05905 [Patescibacteria group bacterium]